MARRHVINTRLDDSEIAHLDEKVRASGLTRSEYTRLVLGGATLGNHVVGKVEGTAMGAGGEGIAVVLTPPASPGRKLQAVPPPTG